MEVETEKSKNKDEYIPTENNVDPAKPTPKDSKLPKLMKRWRPLSKPWRPVEQ